MNRRLAITLLTIILLLITAFPGMAKSETVPISGTCTIIAGAGLGEGVGDVLSIDPKFRFWEPNGAGHWRNQLWLFECDFDDDRLDGYMLDVDNWNTFTNLNKDNPAQTHGQIFSADEDGNIIDLWKGSYVAVYDQAWNSTNMNTYHGLGIYKGLIARFSFAPIDFGVYSVTGELTDTGK